MISVEGARAVVVAAHPDDETIGVGGLMQRFGALVVVHLTDGAPRDPSFARAAGFESREAYAAARRDELTEAMKAIGRTDARLVSLGAVDQEAHLALADHARALAEIVLDHRAEVVVTHPYEGGHPDHDAACFVAHAAVARTSSAATLLEMTSYFDDSEGRLVVGRFFEEDAAADTFLLRDRESARKSAAFAAHRSQRDVLAAFTSTLDHERLRRAPAHDWSKPPCAGVVRYEKLGWNFDFSTWRAHASAASKELARR